LYVGIPECYLCHADGSIKKFEGKQIVSRWLNGPHGNNESRNQFFQPIDLHPENTGFPFYGFGGLGTDPDCTTECHDQIANGELLEGFWEETGIDYLGRVNRPIIACESCHGSGNNHFGIGEMQFPRPDPARCGQCHNEKFDHNEFHPEGDNIIEDYMASPHADSINQFNYVSGSDTDVQALCSKCHTDEGAKLYKDVSGGHDELIEELGSKPPVEDATVVQCRTCHNPHDPDELLFADLLDNGQQIIQSAEYLTCSNCHQNNGSFGLADGFHGENSGFSWSGGPPSFPVGVPPFHPDEIIYDTHFDNPDTGTIEGYNLGPITDGNSGLASERLCRDCHNVHAADNTKNNEWARSGHGGYIAEIKEAADASDPQNILDAAVQGSPFDFYNFATFAGGSCARCHTATGAKNYLNDPENYSARNNDFSHLSGDQKELMYCWGCHANNSGELRNPGPITVDYRDAPYTYPDLRGANICIACHAGRESGDSIKNSDDDFSDKSFINSHYLTAGGTLFNTTGYEFNSRDYTNSIFYIHDRIGLINPPETGDNGPCIGCHMKTDESHLFLPTKKNAGGEVIELTSFEQTCSECHSGPEELINQVNYIAAGFAAALEALRIELADNGYVFLGHHPYFDNTDWTSTNDPTGKDNMGAAFNYNLLIHEPCAPIHNLQYTRKLIYDSIDFLDDGNLNSSVEATLGSGAAYDFLAGTRP
jgi:nitrate/TMAO reductase-like tetraheme cytochrome c subunit